MSHEYNFQAGSDDWRYTGYRGNWAIVDYLKKCGLNIMPLRCDGSKSPKIQWGEYQLEQVPDDTIYRNFVTNYSPSGIGVICGVTSGYLEILDFDGPHLFMPWCKAVAMQLGAEFVKRLVVVQTPKGGYHLYYRCVWMSGNEKLAWNAENVIQIETRGQGGQAVMPGSPNWTHKSNKPYTLIRGTFDAIPQVGAAQRTVMMDVAKSFDLAPPKPPRNADEYVALEYKLGVGECYGDRPGDDFNERAEWASILEPAGWTCLREAAGVSYWQRPGKDGTGPSASVGHCKTERGKELMKVFSSNASPLEADRTYDKFSLYTYLNHGGDFKLAAEKISEAGYGKYANLAQHEEEVNEFMQRHYND